MSVKWLLMITLLSLWCPWGSVHGQGPLERPQTTTPRTAQEEASTEIGQSGYVVKVPEIRMRSIIGERPQKKTVEEEPRPEPVSPVQELKDDPVISAEPPADQVNRLPFDPVDSEHRASSPLGEPTPEPPIKADPETEKQIVERIQDRPQPEEVPPKPMETIDESPVYHPPVAPEETYDPSFVPQKEILRRTGPHKIPAVAELEVRSGKISRLELGSRFADDPIPPEDWLSLGKRPEPVLLELPEPVKEQVAEQPREDAETPRSYFPEETRTGDSPRGKPVPLETRDGTPPGPETETVPRKPVAPEESPAKETIPTPLDDDALDSREARDYLRQTAPIMEELSLLMIRAPGLTIVDYDPSETNTALIPEEIKLKMASIKRELQVLDSKTFAVIPPSKYLAFHELVRQSIAHTYMACDEIINYFDENKVENFQKAKEHLVKAGDFIRRTARP